jgi:hypothetical protein
MPITGCNRKKDSDAAKSLLPPTVSSRSGLIQSEHKLITIEGVGADFKESGFGIQISNAFVHLKASPQLGMIGARLRAVGVLQLTNLTITEQQVKDFRKFASENPGLQFANPTAGTEVLFFLHDPKVTLIE